MDFLVCDTVPHFAGKISASMGGPYQNTSRIHGILIQAVNGAPFQLRSLLGCQNDGRGASGRQELRPEDTEADGEADAEDDSVNDEVTTENIRPRPQGSSPVYEYCIEDEYFNKKLQQDRENRQRRDSSIKMSDSQESMEVTLQTEVESGASGFSVAGGGSEGIFVKQVLKESPASKLFSLKEGDQLLSATIFFDNIKYEDALKILQYSEPYKVQFSLKRKLIGKEELETMHSATQSKKEKLSQGKEALEISEKTISEEDKANLIVKQRVGRQKRTKKDRLSWPKFQSMKGKKILGHRRSRSTSDAYEHTIPDISPTSTDTESQFQQEELHAKIKKGSQKKLKFPSIGFKMHRSKQETEERTKYEVKPLTEFENDTTVEIPELNTAEYSTAWEKDRRKEEKEKHKKPMMETKLELPHHTKKYPEVELTIKKPKDKKLKSENTMTQPETSIITSQITSALQTNDMNEVELKLTSQPLPKARKKKHKGSKEKIELEMEMEGERGKKEKQKTESKEKIAEKIKEDSKVMISAPDMRGTISEAILAINDTTLQVEAPSAEVALDEAEIKLESMDNKLKMPKFHMPKFGVSSAKGKRDAQGEITLPSVDVELPKPELKAEVTMPSITVEGDMKVPQAKIEAPSLKVEVAEKGKFKMPDVKMPSAKMPKVKAPQVGVSLPKVEADVSLPKAKVEIPETEVLVKVPEAEGSVEGPGMKIHMPKFKMPSMGFSKPDIKGPKVDADLTLPKVDATLPSADLSITKPELKTADLQADVTLSAPDVKIPSGQASLDLKAPDLQVEAPSVQVALDGAGVKVEGIDSKFKMPKFHMPKFGVSSPKGKAAAESEITLPSVEVELPKPELKAEVTMPSVTIEGDMKVPQAEIESPSLEVEMEEKSKFKMPDVKMPSVKMPKVKVPQVGVSLPKVEADVSLPKAKVEMPETEVSVKIPEAEGSVEGPGMKIHMPKFRMPSMGFSKPDIKGPKVDADLTLPKVDATLPSADLSITKPELKTADLQADVTLSAPDVKIPSGQASLDLKAPDLQVEAPSVQVALDGAGVKVEGIDSKFKMPKFHMPKFGVSSPKGKAAAESEITLPSVEVELPKPELKAEVTMPSVTIEGDMKVPQAEIEAPSLEVEMGEKSKFKMPDVKMPSVKMPKVKVPQVGVSLPKVEADVSLPKAKVEMPETEVSIKIPEAEGSVEGPGMKIHMPKFKMPSMGFSKPDIKGPKVDADLTLPKVDATLPSADLSITKPELKTADLQADVTLLAPDVKIPSGQASLDLKAPDLQVEAPSVQVALDGAGVKVEGVDGKFKMPKFHMPKFGVSSAKGKAAAEGEITLPSVDVELPKPELKAEVTMPSVTVEGDMKVPQAKIEAPSLEVEIAEKGKFKMPDVKMPSVKMPKVKAPQVGVSLPKVEASVSLPKSKVEMPETEVSVKVPEAEGSVEGAGMTILMPKFKMPSMGFSTPDIKGPKVEADLTLPKVDATLPSADLSITKPELKTADLQADVTLSAPDVKIPSGQASLDLKAPDLQVEAPSVQVALDGAGVKLEGVDSKFQMPKFHMPKFGVSSAKGKAAAEGEITLPSVEVELPKPELKAEVTMPLVTVEGDMKVPQAEIEAPSLEVEMGEKSKFKMPDVKMPSVKMPKVKAPQVGVSLPKVEADVSLPKAKVEMPETEVSVKIPEAEGSVEGPGMKIHMPKFKMPSMGFSKPDVKGPKVEADLILPKVDATLPSADLSITKPELKTADLQADVTLSAPDVNIPSDPASLDLKAPDLQVEAPSVQVALDGAGVKVEGVDSKFKMPKFHMPKFGVSSAKGKAAAEGEITLPSVDVDLPKPELKAEVTMPSITVEGDMKVPQAKIEAPSLEVEIAEKGKFKMPDVKMPSVKMPKVKAPQVGVSLTKMEADVSLPKAKVEMPETEVSVKVPEAEGSVEGAGMKIHMPKFKMPSMGFTTPDIKGPKVEADLTLPKVDATFPSADLSITKPELKTADLQADVTLSAPDVKIPSVQASLDMKAPDLQVEAPSVQVALDGAGVKLEGVDSKFQMPKFHMPKFGVSSAKGKAAAEGEITLPSVEVELPKPELKAEVTMPSVTVEGDMKVPQAEIEAPSLEVETAEKGKFKMPDVKMASVKMPKVKAPQVGVSLPKVEADISLPKGEVQMPETEFSVKVPEAEGSVEGAGMKIHMPKFKMPSMGFSKPDIKGPKVEADLTLPKVDATLPSVDLSITKPELKTADLQADVTLSAPDVKIPSGQASLDLKAPDLQVEAPSVQIALDGAGVKIEGVDSKFKMPKFHMPKFGVSSPKRKAAAEGEITLPSVDVELPKPELKAEVTMPSVTVEGDMTVPLAEIEAPSLEVEMGEKGKLKMPDVKMPGVKMPKVKAPQLGVSLPKVEADTSLPKGKVDIPETEVSIKVPEAEGSVEGPGMKIHMPKFKMPSMGFSKPDIKGPKVDADLTLPKVDATLPSADLSITKPELKTADLQADVTLSARDVKIPSDQASLDLKAPDLQVEAPSVQVALDRAGVKVEGIDSKFKMPKFHMPKFGVSSAKGKAAAEGEITLTSVEVELPKPELKAEVTMPSVTVEGDMKVPQAKIEAPSLEVEMGEKSKFKMPDVKMPSVKMPKVKAPQVGVSLPKVEADVSLPKAKVEMPEAEVSVKIPEAEGSVEGPGMKIHMPKFKMPSMGFSKPDIKGPKVDADLTLPKVDATLPSADLSITKPELKTADLQADITLSAPDVKIPSGQASLDLKAPDLQVEAPSVQVALHGAGVKVEGIDSKFKMPKFHMPKFGVSSAKGKAAAEGEITLPSVEVELPKPELKAEVTMPSVTVEGDIKVPQAEIEAPSLEVEMGEKSKFKMPDVKMPSVKMPKVKAPQVGVSLPKVEADVSLPKAKVEMPEAEVSVKIPEAEGSVEGPGMKIHMPKFKMPSMGFSKPDIKGPKVDADLTLPKVDVTLPSADLSITKPELKTADLQADVTLSAPDVKIPSGQASLDLKAPDLQVEAPSVQVALDGAGVKIEAIDSKFKMPKFHMPKFGVSSPKGKAAAESEITLPSVEVELPKPELKAEVTMPSVTIEGDMKVPQAEIESPSLEVEIEEKSKFKMPDVKMPSVKMPKVKAPQVGVSLPKVEADVSLPKAKVEMPEAEVSVKIPEAEGSVEGPGMKIHMPKFKMPSMGFSKPDIKGPKVDADLTLPKVDATLPSADLSITKPELKTADLQADITLSAPDVKIPSGQASLDLKAPDLQVEAPSVQVALDGAGVKVEGIDSKFKMPKFHMPKFGVSSAKGKAAAEGEITLPSVEVELPKPELKAEVTMPSVTVEGDIKVPQAEIEAPSLEVEMGEKSKFKMPDVKMPSVKMPKVKAPQVGVSLPKVEADVSLPKAKVEMPEAEVSVKIPEAEGSVEGPGMKIHMPKFKMPSMGFSKPDIKGPKVDADLTLPKVDATLPSADLSITKPELKTADLQADVTLSTPDVKIPSDQASLDLKAPDLQVEAPSVQVALDGAGVKVEGIDSKFKMPKFHMPKFGVSSAKGKAAAEGEITLPSVEVELPKPELKAEVTMPLVTVEGDMKVPQAEIEAPSLEVEMGEKSKFKMPDVKMPSVKMPKVKAPQVGVSLPKVEADVSLPKAKVEMPEAEVSVKIPEAEGSVEGPGMKIHMPKFKMPSMGFSKPDIKGPKIDADLTLPKVDATLPSADLSITKPELKTADLQADVTLSAPDMKIPSDQASLDLKAPDLQVEAPSVQVALDGAGVKVEGIDSKFKMPKFHMPKFGVSSAKGKAAAESEITLPSMDVELPKPELKAEVTMPSVTVEGDMKVPQAEIEAPSLEVETAEKGKFKMPDVKMPSVKMPKVKAPQVGVSLPKVEADVSLPKGEVQMPETEFSVKVPEAEGSVEGAGMKIHMPKFKMPSMGFYKPDIKGPKVEADLTLPKVDATLPSVDLSITKPELKTADLQADVTLSAPDVKIPSGQASLDLKAPDLQVEAPSVQIALDGAGVKVEGVDSKFKMPKFHMPKFGVSSPKRKAAAEGEITLPSVDVELPKPELKAEVTMPSVTVEGDMTVPLAEIEAPSLEVEMGEKGKLKMPDVKMPSVKMPKVKAPQLGVSLPKVQADVSLPKGKVDIPETEVSVKIPEAEGSVEGPGMKIHMPKFKMPSMGFSKPDIKGPKVDADLTLPKVDATLPSADLSITKPELKTADLQADVTLSAPDVKIPSGQASLDLKAPDLQVEAPSVQVALDGAGVKVEGVDSKFKMPKFHMPKFGVSSAKGKAAAESEITLPSVEVELPKPELKAEVTMPSVTVEGDMKAPLAEIEAPSLEVEMGEKGKFKMPDVKTPSVKIPKVKTPQVEVSLPKVEANVSLPKAKVEMPEAEVSVKVPKAEDSVEGARMKIHMPKFRMPSMGFSKPDAKGPEVEVDLTLPKVDATLPSADASIIKPELKTSHLQAGVKDIKTETVEKDTIEKESKFKMPKFKLPSFSWSPKKEASASADIGANLEDSSVTLLTYDTEPELILTVEETDGQTIELETHMSIDKDSEKSRIRRPQFSMPKISLPKMKGHKAELSLPELETDTTISTSEGEGEISLQIPEKEITASDVRKDIKMPNVKLPSLELSKAEIKAPKIDMEASITKRDAQLPTVDIGLSEQELKPGDVSDDISKTGEIKVPMVKGVEVIVEGPSTEIPVDGAEMKSDTADGKIKRSKFQMPKFGISFSKGKVPEAGISLPSKDIDVPQLKTTADIADIAMEAPTCEAEYHTTDAEKNVVEGNIKISQIATADLKIEVDINKPSDGSSLAQPETKTPYSDATETKLEKEMRTGSLDVEQKEGNFKMPKFKLPSFNWSPKKEAIKTNIKEPLEETKLTTDTDAEIKVFLSQDQEVHMDQDAESSSKKSQAKRPHFIMPKISLPKTKLTKSQDKAETDIIVERDGALVQIPDIESSFTTTEEQTEISIKMPKGISTSETKASQKDAAVTLPKADIDLSTIDSSSEVKSSEIGLEGEIVVDRASVTTEDKEGKINLPKLQMPKFGIAVPEKEWPESGTTSTTVEAGVLQQQVTLETDRFSGGAPTLEVKVDAIDAKVTAGKSTKPQTAKGEIKAPDTSVVSPDEKDVKLQGELEAKPGEVQIEESQGWFKMPKFRMPSFGRSFSKGKKGDAEVEGGTGKAPMAEVEIEITASEVAAQSSHVDIESNVGKDVLEGKVIFHQEEITDSRISVQEEKGSDVGLLGEGSLSPPSGKADHKVTAPGIKTYADMVKQDAKAQSLQIHEPTATVPVSQTNVANVDIDITLPKCDIDMQYKTKPMAEASSMNIILGRTEGKMDAVSAEAEVVLPSSDAAAKAEKSESQIKSSKTSIQGKESIFKMPKFGVPSFGWSTTKSTGSVADVIVDQKEPDVVPSEVKIDDSITEEDFEIIDFPIEDFEKETEDKMKAEDKGGLSKTKMSKFKMPKFGNLRTKPKVPEVLIDSAKLETEVSLVKTEDVLLGNQVQKVEHSADIKIPKTYFTEKPIDTTDKQFEDSELSFHIPKLKMPKFTHRTSTVEGQILPSEGTVDKKSAGIDIDIDGALQPEFSTTFLEEKIETGDNIQKSKVKITTLSEPTIQRTHVESKLPSTESCFTETTTHIQRPTEFCHGFPTEIIQTTSGKIQKSVAKITTLMEPDIQTTQLEIKLPPEDSFISSTPLHIQGQYTEGKEIKIVSKSEFSCGDEESFSTEIVKESEIPPSEVKTAAYGFSLLKVKIQESHVTVDTPVKLSSTECMNEIFESKDHQPSHESSGQATQKTGFTELKLSDKGQENEFTEGISSTTTLTKVKAFTVEVQSSSEFADSHHDKQPEETSESATEVTEETKVAGTETELADQKEKSESKRSSGKFKFWFPSIGFSSSADDETSDSKPEAQKSLPEAQPDDPSTSDSDSAKQTEKTGWFRFPKLGFSSPTKKSKESDKEDLDPTERNIQDDESPTEKSETFFDAQETLPPKETITEKGGGEPSGAIPCEPIVSSAARTELILLEKEKATPQSVPEEASK